MAITFRKLIDDFISGAKDGQSGTKTKPGSLKIIDNQLIHYSTPILERFGDSYILNITRYSLQTGLLQKKIKSIIPENQRIDIKGVPQGPQPTLSKYIESQKL